MQLHVLMDGNDPDVAPLELEVDTFDDLDKIAARVGRTVSNFLRSVPVRRGRTRARFDVIAYYTETPENGAGKRRRGKKAKPAAPAAEE